MSKPTPMMQQYLEIKERYPGALLFYRMGDFYELFMEDAEVAAPVLEVALTTRGKHLEKPIPMCGVPYHAAEGYIAKLVGAGHKVAICDQVEDPKAAKGIVRREVTRVITPGLILESRNLAANEPNYIAALTGSDTRFGLAYLDISTAEFKLIEMNSPDELWEELFRVGPKELLLPSENHPLAETVGHRLEITVTPLESDVWQMDRAEEKLLEHFGIHSLQSFGIDEMTLGVPAAAAVLTYAETNLFASCSHIRKLIPYSRYEYLILDEATLRNLEIFRSSSFQGRKGSLLHVLDRTRTAMGGRKLQQWLRYPLIDPERILYRQEAVARLAEDSSVRQELLARLGQVHDLERLMGRITIGTANPRDLAALRKSLEVLPHLRELLSQSGGSWEDCASALQDLLDAWDDLEDVREGIDTCLAEEPPATLSAGGVIRPEAHPELDEYVRLSRDAKGWMADYEQRQREETGIGSLKIRYNKVFGYYIEVSRPNLAAVPSHYMRKQTLVNAERFVTEELKDFETKVLEADEKRLELEQRLFVELRQNVARENERVQAMAESLARLDCLSALAEVASRNRYCRPVLDRCSSIKIRDGRHPVIERFLRDGDFVPNDLDLDQEEQQILIITGPNMAGKSTILRQAALIVLMAQMGSFVPAGEAHIGVVDRLFTRVGASDDLTRGRSTFMVEMQEAAYILHQATPRSLVILDEIGRGTSTFDGMSIAWAMAEYLHDHQGEGVKTLFATHYHELTELARSRARVKNFNVAVKEWEDEISFFFKLTPGGANRSYGIQVARLAGLPPEVTGRAKQILAGLENGGGPQSTSGKPSPAARRPGRTPGKKEAGLQLSLFQPSLDWLKERILALDPDRMTPLAALQTLYALREQLGGDEKKAAGGEADSPLPPQADHG